MNRAIVFEPSPTNPPQFKYSAQTNPSPLVTTPATAPQTPDNSLEILINVPASSSYTVKTITFTVTGLMQNADNLSLTVYDPNDNEWSFANSGTTFTLSPSSEFTLSNTVIAAEIAGFVTPADAGGASVAINEQLIGSPAGTGTLSIGIFPLGFFFDGLGAWVQEGSIYVPVAEVANGTAVQLQWSSSALESQISIYQSGVAEPATPDDIGYWNSPPLTEDTVFTVAAIQDGVPLSQSVAVSVSNPNIVAQSLTASGAITGGSLTVDSATINGPLTLAHCFGQLTRLTVPSNWKIGALIQAQGSYVATADGFLNFINGGWFAHDGTTGLMLLEVAMGSFFQTSFGTGATRNSFCMPVVAGETVVVNLFAYGIDSIPQGLQAGQPNFFYLPFGNGTITSASMPAQTHNATPR